MANLIVSFPDKTKWSIPVGVLLTLRAEYFAAKAHAGDGPEEYNEVYAEEMQAEYDDILTWAHNNLEWSDVCDDAEKIEEGDLPDYQGWWASARKRIE